MGPTFKQFEMKATVGVGQAISSHKWRLMRKVLMQCLTP